MTFRPALEELGDRLTPDATTGLPDPAALEPLYLDPNSQPLPPATPPPPMTQPPPAGPLGPIAPPTPPPTGP